jgi:hypothetical protein
LQIQKIEHITKTTLGDYTYDQIIMSHPRIQTQGYKGLKVETKNQETKLQKGLEVETKNIKIFNVERN